MTKTKKKLSYKVALDLTEEEVEKLETKSKETKLPVNALIKLSLVKNNLI